MECFKSDYCRGVQKEYIPQYIVITPLYRPSFTTLLKDVYIVTAIQTTHLITCVILTLDSVHVSRKMDHSSTHSGLVTFWSLNGFNGQLQQFFWRSHTNRQNVDDWRYIRSGAIVYDRSSFLKFLYDRCHPIKSSIFLSKCSSFANNHRRSYEFSYLFCKQN